MIKKWILFAAVILADLSWAPRQIEWVAIGDSITYLNDHPDETGNRVEKGYMSRVAELLPHVRYVNKGHNGWTSVRIADRINELGLQKADAYTVFLGTNDWWKGQPVGSMNDYTGNTGSQTVYGAFRIIIDKLRSLNGNAPIILITPLQRGDFVYISNSKNNAYGSYKDKNGQSLSKVADAIKQIGKHEHLEVVDLYYKSGITQKNMVKFKRLKNPATNRYVNYSYPDFTDIPFNPETDEYPYPVEAADMTYDGLHPSDRGNAVIAKMLAESLKKIK
jgi:lysophospholipase L1-like esterase